MKKFIYIFSSADRDALSARGYKLLKTDNRNNIYIFENKPEAVFDFGEIKHIDSDIITF